MLRLREIAAQLKNPQALYKDVGRRAVNDLRKHFRTRNETSPNKKGWERQNFWAQVMDTVQQPVAEAGGVAVPIGHAAIGIKVHGGEIRPRRRRALTIPLHALAYGRTAKVFESETGLKLFRPKRSRVLCAVMTGRVVAIYALAGRVRVNPDPEALPDAEKFEAGLLDTAEKHLARRKSAAGPAAVFY